VLKASNARVAGFEDLEGAGCGEEVQGVGKR